MKLSEDLAWRGLIKDKTFTNPSWLDEPKTFYLGIDASADSLTIGNLAVLMLVRRLVKGGWQPVLLAGGATTLIGDPGGKEEERQLKTPEEISANISAIKEQMRQLLPNNDFELVDNYQWFKDIKFLDFLRDVGKNYSLSELVQRDFIAQRMGKDGSGISYAEFSYSLIQGYDFWWLFKNKNVKLQIGASDQWGNMLSGVSLIRKKENAEVHAFSMPLVVNKATGKKFGKTEEGAVWLDTNKTTPFQFYQFWINLSDEDVEYYLKIYTELTKDEIKNLMTEFGQNRAARKAQRVLAYEVTKIVHGEAQAKKQQNVTDVLFSGKGLGGLDESDLASVRNEFPNQKVSAGTPIIEVLTATELAFSNSEARRLKSEGAIYLNNESFNKDHLEASDFENGKALIRRGKALKDSALIELN